MYSIDFMKIETHGKLSFHCSDFWPLIRSASTTYTKDGVKRHHAHCSSRLHAFFLRYALCDWRLNPKSTIDSFPFDSAFRIPNSKFKSLLASVSCPQR